MSNHLLHTTAKLTVPLSLMLLFSFEIILAAQTNYSYLPKEKTWQEDQSAQTIIDLQEQKDEDLQNSECAAYCTSRDSKFT